MNVPHTTASAMVAILDRVVMDDGIGYLASAAQG
jgi:hypothetical protein